MNLEDDIDGNDIVDPFFKPEEDEEDEDEDDWEDEDEQEVTNND